MCSICTDTSQQCKSLSLYQYSIDQRRSRVPPVHACLGFSVSVSVSLSLSLSLPVDLGLAASRTSLLFLKKKEVTGKSLPSTRIGVHGSCLLVTYLSCLLYEEATLLHNSSYLSWRIRRERTLPVVTTTATVTVMPLCSTLLRASGRV